MQRRVSRRVPTYDGFALPFLSEREQRAPVLMPNDLIVYYWAKAEEAERKAKSAFHPEDSDRFQQLAREWRTIAEQAERWFLTASLRIGTKRNSDQ